MDVETFCRGNERGKGSSDVLEVTTSQEKHGACAKEDPLNKASHQTYRSFDPHWFKERY